MRLNYAIRISARLNGGNGFLVERLADNIVTDRWTTADYRAMRKGPGEYKALLHALANQPSAALPEPAPVRCTAALTNADRLAWLAQEFVPSESDLLALRDLIQGVL